MRENEIQNNKLQILGKLAASLAHEIRNPLSAIKLNLEFVQMSELEEEVKESIDSCIEAACRIQHLIDSTLDFSRTSLNDTSFQSLNDVAALAIEIMNAKARILNIKVESRLDHSIPLISFNRNKVLQVVLNLLTNAFEAIEKQGTVQVSTYYDNANDSVILHVNDNGRGISEENKEKIFKDFYTNKKEGTGLGLSVCKRILDEFKASIDFESQVGKGTSFFVKFTPKK